MAGRKALALKSQIPQVGRLRSIEGRHNALVKQLRKAFAAGEQTSDGCIAIEGLRVVDEAIRSGLKFRTVFFSASAEGKAERLLPQLGAHVETVILPDKLFSTAVPSEAPQGVAALVRCRSFTLDDVLAKAEAGPVVVIIGLQDPGNLGTIVRSAEAFCGAGVLLGEGTVSPFNAKAVRASAGSLFRLPVVKVKVPQVLGELRDRGLQLVATSSHKGISLPEAALTGPLAIFVGGEGAGLGRDLIAEMAAVIMIPHSPKVESLNAGVAASVVLYEVARQRK
ncbi:MAG TPA: RNA methyltransferase [Terriglobales bacterium]|nr:RNA methyltransferase [Terriglobales bacterium]